MIQASIAILKSLWSQREDGVWGVTALKSLTVKPKEGWRPNRVYRVQLLPGLTDLRQNPSREGAVLTFSTGAPRPRP